MSKKKYHSLKKINMNMSRKNCIKFFLINIDFGINFFLINPLDNTEQYGINKTKLIHGFLDKKMLDYNPESSSTDLSRNIVKSNQ